MKRTLGIALALTLLLTACAAPAATETDETAAATESATPVPVTTQDAIAAASADELRAMIELYEAEENYEMAYAAASRLLELDPSDTDAYTDAMDALLAISLANNEEINRLLAQGSENAQDAQTLVWWVKEHQSDFSLELPFMPDYDSPDEINTEGITAGNLSNAMKDGSSWKAGLLTSQGDWLYLSQPGESYAIYKMRSDGSEYQRIGSEYGSSLNVVGDWIYYINLLDSGKLYKIRTDGSLKTKLSDDTAEFLSVSNGWMYYNNLNEGGCLYKVKTDGSGQTRLTSETVLVPIVSGDWVYYRCGDEADGLWRISVSGGESQSIVRVRMQEYCIMDDWVYYVDMDNPYCVRRVHTDGTGYEFFYPCEMAPSMINGANGTLYLPYNVTCEGEGLTVCAKLLVLDTTTLTRLQDLELEIGPVCVGPGGQMYFLKYIGSFAWYALDTGGEVQKIG